jgi:hydroxysqualene dehydroxylase
VNEVVSQILPPKPHCVVLGGGVAGITAAVRLVERGFHVTLVEARADLGGRVQSFIDSTTGDIIDNGQHVLMGCYTSTLQLAATLGTTHVLRRQKALNVWFADCTNMEQEEVSIFALNASFLPAILPAQIGMAVGMMRLHGLSIPEKYALMRFALRLQFGLVRPDGQTALHFLQEERQTARVIKRLWEPIILATLNAPVHAASATLFVTVLRLAFFAGGDAAHILLAETGLAELLGPARNWLQERGSCVVHGVAKNLLVEHERVVGVNVKNNDGNVMTLKADTVISTLPAMPLFKILPETTRLQFPFSRWHEFPQSPIVSVLLWFDRAFMEQDFIALLGTTVQWVFNRRKIGNAKAAVVERFPCHLSLTISAANGLEEHSSAEIVEVCLQDLRRTFPASRSAKLLHSRVMRERQATPLLTPFTESLRPDTRTPLQGLFLAGDWTKTGLPATIEGAVRSGEIAAEAVARAVAHSSIDSDPVPSTSSTTFFMTSHEKP